MTKPTDDQYREAARRIYRDGEAHVSLWAAIQRVHGDGAFVELTVWVPVAEALKEVEQQSDEGVCRSIGDVYQRA